MEPWLVLEVLFEAVVNLRYCTSNGCRFLYFVSPCPRQNLRILRILGLGVVYFVAMLQSGHWTVTKVTYLFAIVFTTQTLACTAPKNVGN